MIKLAINSGVSLFQFIEVVLDQNVLVWVFKMGRESCLDLVLVKSGLVIKLTCYEFWGFKKYAFIVVIKPTHYN